MSVAIPPQHDFANAAFARIGRVSNADMELGEDGGVPGDGVAGQSQSQGISVPAGEAAASSTNGTALHSDASGKAMPDPPSSLWTASCHPLGEKLSRETNEWFMENWPFPDNKSRQRFLENNMPRMAYLYYPTAKDDRIHFACRLIGFLLLTDDLLESMSLDQGKAWYEKLMSVGRGDVAPNPDEPTERMFGDLCESMRAHDKDLADDVIEALCSLMNSQVDRTRLEIKELGEYSVYRREDFGMPILFALMRFVMELHLSPDELREVEPAELNCGRHITLVNDVCSWAKELRSAQLGHEEGSSLCSAVSILASSAAVGYDAAKACLWTMVREYERIHEKLYADSTGLKRRYLQGLMYQMSGNELWSKTSKRYLVVEYTEWASIKGTGNNV